MDKSILRMSLEARGGREARLHPLHIYHSESLGHSCRFGVLAGLGHRAMSNYLLHGIIGHCSDTTVGPISCAYRHVCYNVGCAVHNMTQWIVVNTMRSLLTQPHVVKWCTVSLWSLGQHNTVVSLFWPNPMWLCNPHVILCNHIMDWVNVTVVSLCWPDPM